MSLTLSEEPMQPPLLEVPDHETGMAMCMKCGEVILENEDRAYDAWDRLVHLECLIASHGAAPDPRLSRAA
jgi:hypothetical protein